MRYPIIAFSLIWACVSFIYAPQMGPQTKQEPFLKESHPLQKIFNALGKEFDVSSEGLPDVHVYFGADTIDRAGDSPWNSEFIGKLIYDDEFDITPVEA